MHKVDPLRYRCADSWLAAPSHNSTGGFTACQLAIGAAVLAIVMTMMAPQTRRPVYRYAAQVTDASMAALGTLATTAGATGFVSVGHGIKRLDPPNWEKLSDAQKEKLGAMVGKWSESAETSAVLIFAPWCQHCKTFQPVFEDFVKKRPKLAAVEINYEATKPHFSDPKKAITPITHFPTFGALVDKQFRTCRSLEELDGLLRDVAPDAGEEGASAKRAELQPFDGLF